MLDEVKLDCEQPSCLQGSPATPIHLQGSSQAGMNPNSHSLSGLKILLCT